MIKMNTLDFKATPPEGNQYLGRNGYGNCVGVITERLSSSVRITPINSKGNIARCFVEIPTSEVEEFVKNVLSEVTEKPQPQLTVFIEDKLLTDEAEEIEDDLAEYLGYRMHRGRVEDTVTGNTTTFEPTPQYDDEASDERQSGVITPSSEPIKLKDGVMTPL